GVSGSGRRPSGTSNNSRPFSSRECPEAWAETLEDLSESAQTRPRARIAHRRRTERREVPKDHRVRRLLPVERTAEPRLGAGAARLAACSPNPSRRHLHQRNAITDGGGERVLVPLGPGLV